MFYVVYAETSFTKYTKSYKNLGSWVKISGVTQHIL